MYVNWECRLHFFAFDLLSLVHEFHCLLVCYMAVFLVFLQQYVIAKFLITKAFDHRGEKTQPNHKLQCVRGGKLCGKGTQWTVAALSTPR